jgi:hypothetical protein
VADRKDALRALGERLLESVTEYQRALYHEFLAAREEISWRYRYAEAARRDLAKRLQPALRSSGRGWRGFRWRRTPRARWTR